MMTKKRTNFVFRGGYLGVAVLIVGLLAALGCSKNKVQAAIIRLKAEQALSDCPV